MPENEDKGAKPLLEPPDKAHIALAPVLWTVPAPHPLKGPPDAEAATQRFLMAFAHLQRVDWHWLEALNRAALEHQPLTVYVEGAEPDEEKLLALLRCAQEFGASLTLVPGPPPEKTEGVRRPL